MNAVVVVVAVEVAVVDLRCSFDSMCWTKISVVVVAGVVVVGVVVAVVAVY